MLVKGLDFSLRMSHCKWRTLSLAGQTGCVCTQTTNQSWTEQQTDGQTHSRTSPLQTQVCLRAGYTPVVGLRLGRLRERLPGPNVSDQHRHIRLTGQMCSNIAHVYQASSQQRSSGLQCLVVLQCTSIRYIKIRKEIREKF